MGLFPVAPGSCPRGLCGFPRGSFPRSAWLVGLTLAAAERGSSLRPSSSSDAGVSVDTLLGCPRPVLIPTPARPCRVGAGPGVPTACEPLGPGAGRLDRLCAHQLWGHQGTLSRGVGVLRWRLCPPDRHGWLSSASQSRPVVGSHADSTRPEASVTSWGQRVFGTLGLYPASPLCWPGGRGPIT